MKKHTAAKCLQFQQDAIAMMGVELSDDEEANLFDHLANCPVCRLELRKDRRLLRALNTSPVITAQPSFSRMLSLRLALEEPSEPEADQIDRVLPDMGADLPVSEVHYDLSSLASIFASEMPQ
ncbi:MAG: hypothetical protein ACOX3G_04160 [Armatimonadota bacterium]